MLPLASATSSRCYRYPVLAAVTLAEAPASERLPRQQLPSAESGMCWLCCPPSLGRVLVLLLYPPSGFLPVPSQSESCPTCPSRILTVELEIVFVKRHLTAYLTAH